MSLSDLASIGSFVSGVAVLISLVYLALQVRQAERNQRAMLQHGRAARATDLLVRMAEDEIADVLSRGSFGEEELTKKEELQFVLIFRANIIGMEDTYFQHKHNMLDDESFHSSFRMFRPFFAAPGFRAAWKRSRPMYDESFAKLVDQIAAEVAVTSRPSTGAWKDAVAAELAS
jgi:hypothetical protein